MIEDLGPGCWVESLCVVNSRPWSLGDAPFLVGSRQHCPNLAQLIAFELRTDKWYWGLGYECRVTLAEIHVHVSTASSFPMGFTWDSESETLCRPYHAAALSKVCSKHAQQEN